MTSFCWYLDEPVYSSGSANIGNWCHWKNQTLYTPVISVELQQYKTGSKNDE